MARRKGEFSADVKAVIAARAGHRCERCRRSVLNYPSNIHHRRARGMGGTSNPKLAAAVNGVLLCGTATTGCHGEVEANPGLARDTGWKVSFWADPETTLLMRLDGTVFRLSGDVAVEMPGVLL